VIVRYVWLLWQLLRGQDPEARSDQVSSGCEPPFALASGDRAPQLLGLPIGHAMIAASILYLY
jgi:hypothetical protein